MKNNYSYNDPNDIIFLPFQKDLQATNGKLPDSVGNGCVIVADEKPKNALGSLFCQSGQTVNFKELDVAFKYPQDDFTIDFYMRFQGSAYSGITTMYVNSPTGISIEQEDIWYGNRAAGNWIHRGTGFIANEWAHYALVRKAGINYWFINGKLISTKEFGFDIGSTDFSINTRYVDSYVGGNNYYAFVRISNKARWTEDFIPPEPTEELPEYPGPAPDQVDMKLHILLKIAQTVNLTGYMWPVGNNPPNLIWSSEDAAIAAVDQNGTVTANVAGKTKIFVQNDDGSFKAFARVKVVEEGQDELLLSILLEIEEECILVPEFDPEEAETAVLWSSSDTSVATVSPVGKVTGIAGGLAIITVKTADGKLTDCMYVTVKV